MTGYDRDYLGGIAARTAIEDPLDMLVQIGRLTHLFERQALVLCLDQLEEIWTYNADAAQRFRDAMGALRALTDKHPGALVVIACLDAYYDKLKELIQCRRPVPARPHRARGTARRSTCKRAAAARKWRRMIAKRLDALYQSQDVELRAEDRTCSLRSRGGGEVGEPASARRAARMFRCRAQKHSIQTGEGPPAIGRKGRPLRRRPRPTRCRTPCDVEQRWNDFRNDLQTPPPEQEMELAALLAWAVEGVNAERETAGAGEESFAARAQPYVRRDRRTGNSRHPAPLAGRRCATAAGASKLSGHDGHVDRRRAWRPTHACTDGRAFDGVSRQDAQDEDRPADSPR